MLIRRFLRLALLFTCAQAFAQFADLDPSQGYEICVMNALDRAATPAEVKAGIQSCQSDSVGMFPTLDIMNRQITGWCNTKFPDGPCREKEVCAPVLGPVVCPPNSDTCATGLVSSGGKCVCPGTAKVATTASECAAPPTPGPTPPSCGQGLQSKNGKCVCPGTTTVASAAAQCKPDKSQLVTPSQVAQDTSRLDDLTSRADLCCHNPSACGAPDTTDLSSLQPQADQGIGDFCNSLQKAGQLNADANSKAAEVCQTSFNTCTTEAQTKLSTYQDLSDQCDGDCDSASLIEAALARFQRALNTCNSFASLVQLMGRQQIASSTAAGKSSFCAQSTSNSAASQPPAFSLNYCVQNPKAPGCQGQVTQEPDRGFGKVGFQSAKIDKPNFNPNEINDLSGFKGYGSPSTADQKNAQTAHAIPGGTSFNAAGDATQAKLDPRSSGAVGPGHNTDIMQGNLAGGYSQSPENDSYSRYGSRFAAASAGQAGAGKNMDLKPYLMPPNRRFPAGYQLQQQNGLLGKWDDIWQHIRDRMELKCKLGVLEGCPSR